MMRLLVPVDLTTSTQPNLSGALSIAQSCGAEVHLVEFLPTPAAGFKETEKTVFETGYAEQEILNAQVVRQHRDQVNKLADGLRSQSVPVQAVVADDTFSAGLEKYIGKHDIDLVLLREQARRSWLEVLTGSRTDRAIEKTDCPVLTVQEPFDFKRLDEIVVAVDLTRDYKSDSWSVVRILSRCLKADTSFLYVQKDLGDVVKVNNRICNFRQKHGFEGFPIYFIQSDNVEEAIVRFAERKNNCLVATISDARGGLLRIFANSIAEAVVDRSDMPVLTLSA
jgi:nucleotide-binding universal stress UspA family protein